MIRKWWVGITDADTSQTTEAVGVPAAPPAPRAEKIGVNATVWCKCGTELHFGGKGNAVCIDCGIGYHLTFWYLP